ncbi:MAG TPA: glycosyltransferase [Chitinophagaceae bacterium]|nr:glycosyltransferase [Chitinophagaceae bacterium]
MPVFSPYSIAHVQVLEAVHFSPPAGNAFLVFWWQKIPLGHLWIQEENPLTQAAFRTAVVAAITPAAMYYFSKAHSNQWQEAFELGNAKLLQEQLQESAAIQTFSKPHSTERLSVVICTRNRTAALKQCIDALQKSIDTAFELVIVDNAPDNDSTEKLVQQYSGVRYVQEPRKGLDIARNTGVAQASGDLIAFTDDDVLVEEAWTENVKKAFANEQTACVTGLVLPAELKTKWQYHFEKYLGFNRGYVPLVFDKMFFSKHKESGVPVWEIGAGANMAFRKSIFQQVGVFDERLDVGAAGCSGDSELWYRALAEGYTCRYFPQLYVQHQHRETEKELRNQVFHYMRGHVASLLVQYERYGHKGNLKRLYRKLPKWYWTRFRNKVRGRNSPAFETLFTEIRGCISGWRFYQKHKPKKG